MKNYTILTTTNDETHDLDYAEKVAKMRGGRIKGTSVWDGPVPPDSFIEIDEFVQMARPEYMFYRKANMLEHDDAVRIGCELLSHYDTCNTCDLPEGVTEYRGEPHTTVQRLIDYLMPVIDTDEGLKALEILSDVIPLADEYEDTLAEMAR